ncbi:MAG TPA: cytochrome c [Polyangiaceae bacterium]|nr:cytochrome c [Polyangiaceae bacterium]
MLDVGIRKAFASFLVSGALALGATGCGRAAGATPAELGKGRDASGTGALLYERNCQSCHGEQGQGTGKAPAILGRRALASGRFRNAEKLFDYVARKMPADEPGRLDIGQYWNIVTFMVATGGHRIPDGRLSEANAAKIKLIDDDD